MRRQIGFLLVLPLAFLVSPPLYAQHGSGGGHGGGHVSGGGLSGHSVGHSIAQSFGHVFGHHSGRNSSQFEKGPGNRGGELPPLAGAAFIHGKVVTLPGPGSGLTLDGQPPHTVRGRFAAAFVPHKPFGANQFDVGFCDFFRFTWHDFLFPDDFDCFGNPFFSHRFFSRRLRGYFWSDSLFAGVWLGASSESIASQAASDSSGLVPRNAPSAPPQDAESSAPSALKAEQPVTLLQLRDGSMYGLIRYWVDGGRLHYVTDYGGEDNVPLESIDFAKTAQLNASRGTPFILQKGANR
jgi:hypothetical protein